MRNKQRIEFSMDKETHNFICVEAAKRGITKSELFSDMVHKYYNDKQNKPSATDILIRCGMKLDEILSEVKVIRRRS